MSAVQCSGTTSNGGDWNLWSEPFTSFYPQTRPSIWMSTVTSWTNEHSNPPEAPSTCKSFITTMPNQTFLYKSYRGLAGKFYCTLYIHPTLCHQISNCLCLHNLFKGQTFNFEERIKIHLEEFLTSKDRKFFEQGIMDLPTRWQKILEQNSNITN